MPNKTPQAHLILQQTPASLTLARRLVHPEDLSLQLKLKLLNVQNSKFS